MKKFDDMDVNMEELERQRYDAIKKTGQYLELNILIGAENEDENEDTTHKFPVVTTTMCHCGSREISCLYATIRAFLNSFEKKYPLECLAVKLGIVDVDDLGSIEADKSKTEE